MNFLALALAVPLASASMTVDVDARDVSRRVLHVHNVVAVTPGALTLHYPKWIPGEHGPTGPIDGIVNLSLSAGGKPLAWRRDPIDMYALHVDVPAGNTSIDEKFDFVTP